MHTLKRSTHFAICCAITFLFGCAKGDDQAAPGLTAADLAGKWDMRSVPFTGDTTPTTYVLTATADNDGWTITFPNRAPIATTVTIEGDSIIAESGPYESVRRKGVQVKTYSVFRLEDDSLVGTSIARYATTGVDSVVRFSSKGARSR